MASTQMWMSVTVILYLIMVVGIGIYFSNKNNDAGDFYLGGRKLGPFVTAMSAEASDMSSYLLLGVPGLAYLTGNGEAFWTVVGLGIGTYINWVLVAMRLRNYTETTNSITLPEFFSKRFGDERKILTAIAAIVIIIFFIPYTASGFSACGKLFNSLFGFDYTTAMIVSALVIVLYTTLGGFLAASTSDFIQGIVMSCALLMIVIFSVVMAGGLGEVIENCRALPGFFSLTATHNPETEGANPFGFIAIVSTLAWGLGYFGMPHILIRFMAIEDDNKLKLSRRIATIWVFIAMGVAMFVGFSGMVLSKKGMIPSLEDSETVIIKLSYFFASYGVLAALLGGLVIAGILAATMSTADSQMLVAASGFSQNFLRDVFKVKMNQRTEMLIARLTVVTIALIAMFFARNPNSSVFRIVSFAWAGFGAAFGPVVLMALFWKRANKWGALAGMVCGGAMVFIWKFLVRPMGGGWDIYELLPAFIVALVAIVVVSLITPAPEQKVLDGYEEYQKAIS
ncbi:MAG: sodium/proline symporter [Firmicutes bacterium]|nr:sodium/proline symporter [Bacillota bacterium]